jgi:cytochrome c-type biogenesis protein CcmI
MDVALLCLAILAAAAYVAAPLYRTPPVPPTERRDGDADASRTALEDLEVDRASGLIDDATYARERAALERRAGASD